MVTNNNRKLVQALLVVAMCLIYSVTDDRLEAEESADSLTTASTTTDNGLASSASVEALNDSTDPTVRLMPVLHN